MKKLNVAILGTGSIAAGGHAPALLESRDAQLWSVMSRDASRAKEFATRFKAKSTTPAYTELEPLLADPELDAVIIATPDKLHAGQAIAAANAGKHVLLEKPLATDAASASQVVEACNRTKITLALCYRLRWHAGHRALVNAAHAGKFGELRHVRSLWSSQQADSSNWRASSDVGRWWALGANGTHLVDMSRWILRPSQGEFKQIAGVIARENWHGPHDETAAATFKFERGATAQICSSVLFNGPSRLEIYGSKGWAVCEDTFAREGGGTIRTNEGDFPFAVVNPFVGLIDDFTAAILERRKPEVDAAEGARNVEILLKLIES